MKRKFFAYHGPQNLENFDYKGGYGVATKSKWENVKNGDVVYVIQNTKEKNKFEFCGIYQVKRHYKNDLLGSKNHFRFELADVTKLGTPIEIDEVKYSQLLPPKKSKLKWSNFKLHFCAQGATFRSELDDTVVKVLNSMLPNATTFQFAEEIPPDKESLFPEGAKQSIIINKYERNSKARNECIKFYGYTCQVCCFDFEKTYGILGRNYIHVHHLVPLGDIGEDYEVNPKKDLIPVCPNCHAMLHRSEHPHNTKELKKLLKLKK